MKDARPRTTYCIILFIWTLRKDKKYSDKKQTSGFKDSGERKGLTTEGQKGIFPGNEMPYVYYCQISANSTS